MARINLLTIHYGQCYGAVMQTYATCRILEKAGHTVNVINIINPNQKGNWKLLSYWKECIREFQFWLFKKRYFPKLTNKAYNINDIHLPASDLTIVGSDQVWNRNITKEFGKIFYLDFVCNQPKVALSSSFGKAHWSEDSQYTNEVKQLLSQFKAISVREKTGVEILDQIFNLPSINLPDPTIGYGQFDDLVLNNRPLHKIFTFLLLRNDEALSIANAISEELHIPLYNPSKISSKIFNGPRHWLTRIKNSDYIITDSFHGLALSVIFKKQFFVLCADEAKFTRLQSLLQLLSLEERFIYDMEDFIQRKDILIRPIDYKSVNTILSGIRHQYEEFLSRFI